MALQRVCDICGTNVDTAQGGTVDAHALHGLGDGEKPIDLCLPHYNAYKHVVRLWKTLETGGTINAEEWPRQRTGTPR